MSLGSANPVRTKVKICGVRDAETALACAHAGADAVGLVFVGASPRAVTLERARGVTEALPPFVTAVGLFVDAPLGEIVEARRAAGFGLVQLHGAESPEFCREVAAETGVGVIKGVRFDEATIDETIAAFGGHAAALLVDGSAGGGGETFNWAALAPRLRAAPLPIVVAGGLTPANVGEAVATLRPFGVDVSSGVEAERGVKDHALIRSFVREASRNDWITPQPE